MHELNLLNEKREMNEAKIKRHAIFCVSRQVHCQHEKTIFVKSQQGGKRWRKHQRRKGDFMQG